MSKLVTDIYLISEQYVKQNSALMQNVEKQFIEQHVLEAQNLDMYHFLGAELYSTLMDAWQVYREALGTATGSAPLPEDVIEQRLITLTYDYIRPMLLYFTLHYSMYDLYTKHTNKGTVEQSSQSSVPASFDAVEKQRKDYRNKGEVYATRMLEFLQRNAAAYPEFASSNTCNDGAPNAFTETWYLGPSI